MNIAWLLVNDFTGIYTTVQRTFVPFQIALVRLLDCISIVCKALIDYDCYFGFGSQKENHKALYCSYG